MSHELIATQGHNSDDHSVILPRPVVTKGHNSDDHSVISPGLVTTKGHSSDLPISSTSFAEINTNPHKYLLATQHITAVTTDTREILMCSWTPSSSFCIAYHS
jgi:hypothetical protein